MGYKRPTIHVPTRPVPTGSEQDFIISAPIATHHKTIPCSEARCPHYLNGWTTIVPADSPQAQYIRHMSGRHFREVKKEGGLVEFIFPPGQTCFNEHDAPAELRHEPHYRRLDKQEIYIHRSVLGHRVHQRPEDWTEHMNEEFERVNRMRQRG